MKPDPPDKPLARKPSPSGADTPSTAPSLHHSITPPSVPDHELLRCIGTGSYGEVWLAHLHQQGLVHRDIKPSNIIFVAGVPKLADIGLVTDASEARSFVGTVGFIPPEGPGSPQADLYSLGKVLYEISTGQDRQDFPQLPPNLRELPDAAQLIELNEVLLKACHKDPRLRYISAEVMLADLELLQRGKSVQRKHAKKRRWAITQKIAVG